MMYKEFLKKVIKDKLGLLSIIILGIVFILGIIAPLAAPNDPNLVDIANKLQKPSAIFPLGTDHLGRCILSRLIYGIRTSFFIGLIIMTITVVIGSIVGITCGFFGGYIDSIIMRICDVMLSFPNLLLILAIVGMLGPSLKNVMIASVCVQWVWYARMIRGMVLKEKQNIYVSAAKICGSSKSFIMIKHILPNIISEIIVLATLDIGWVILNISAMSFLGLGVQPPTPEWGAMLYDGREFIRSNPQLMIYPGSLILIVVLCFNLLGDTLRDIIDPKESGEAA